METKKRLQRFLSIFLACIMIMNVPMSALAFEDVQIVDVVEDEELVVVEEEPASSDEIVFEDEESTIGEEPVDETTVVEEQIVDNSSEEGEEPGMFEDASPELGEGLEIISIEETTLDTMQLAAGEVETSEETTGASLDTSNLVFDVPNPSGYVTVSFEDNGIRLQGDSIEDMDLYGTPLGTIIKPTKVPFVEGENMAQVTVRLLDAMKLGYDCTGTTTSGFYLASIKDFQLNGKYYSQLGEFDAGNGSGWCVRLNNWHINRGASEFTVEDGDTIKWLYTCQYGADVGGNFESKSAEITNVKFADPDIQLEDLGTGDYYFCYVPFSLNELAFEVELENYASVIGITVNGQTVKYRPNDPIPAVAGDIIVINSTLDYMDAENNNQVTTYTDSITIELVGIMETPAPSVKDDAQASLDVTLGKSIKLDYTTVFENIGGSNLTYGIKCEALNLDKKWKDQTYYDLTCETAGEYTVILTVEDGENEIQHSIILEVIERDNQAPSIKTEYATSKEKTYVFTGDMYVHVTLETIFEDKDGDDLEYKILIDGEEYNPDKYEKIILDGTHIVFFENDSVRTIEVTASDGIEESDVFTAHCVGTTATMKLPEDNPLIETDTKWYRCISETVKDSSFRLDYDLTIDKNALDVEWRSENPSVLSVDENGKCTFVGEVTEMTTVKVGITCGTDMWGSPKWLGWIWIDIYPSAPSVDNIEAAVAENEDLTELVEITEAFTHWRAEEFAYTVEDPSVCSVNSCEHWFEYGIDVMPKKVGQTKVTATFKKDSSIKCEFMVTVTGRSLQVKGQDNNNVIFEPYKKIQLEVLGAQEGETFTWMSWDENIAFADDGWVTLFKPGTVYIEAISSLSTDDAPLKAGMYLQIQESGKVYLDELEIPDYQYFEYMIGPKSAFNSAQMQYMWDIAGDNYYYSTLAFTPYFDGENLNAVLKYEDQYKQPQSMELTDGEEVRIYDGISPGYNLVKIEVSPKDDEDNITTYTFEINRPYNPVNVIYDIVVYPNGESALDYPIYKDCMEGTVFQYDKENDTVTDCCWWDSEVYTYKTYVFGTRTNTVSFLPYFGYSGQRVMIYVNGEPLEEAVHDWKCQTIPVTEEEMTIEFYCNSEKYHEEQLAKGVTNPFENPEKIYTLYVENVKPLGIDAVITSAELDNGEFYAPGFKSDVYSTQALIPAGANRTKLTFTAEKELNVYRDYVSEETKLEPENGETEGLLTYVVDMEIPEYDSATAINILLEEVDQNTDESGIAQYQFIARQRGAKDIYPDEIAEYLCLGSQYTNRSTFGLTPERTLVDGGTVLSLGNFGGHIVYKYDTPIQNDPNNPYGVDFVIYGNPFGEGAHEPGNVEVSKDGKTWYLLAGSDHYEDHCDWNYTMTYTNDKGESSWVNSDGASGKIYNYPTASLYPYFNWTESLERSMTVSGPRLNSESEDAYGSAAAVLTEFGYVDVNMVGTVNGKAKNPYNHPNALETGGDQFDISWAVDENGMPVELDSISYIRVSTASSIYAGAIGEKSTEVTTVNRVTNTAAEVVGETAAPTSILVNGKEITVPENGGAVTANFTPVNTAEAEASILTIDVNAAEGSNIYINNTYGATRDYSDVPEKGIVRIIVQEGEKEPYICYLTLCETETAISDVETLIAAIGDVTLNSEKAIAAAREAYEALTETQKAMVNNIDVLVKAEEQIKELVKADNEKKVTAAEDAITAIPSMDNLTADDKAAVEAARAAFEALTDEQKANVSKDILSQLETAEARIAELEAAQQHSHSWGAGVVTKEATCKETGVKTYTCTGTINGKACGQTKTETIAKLTTHKYGSWTTVSEATVSAAKVQKHTCSICGKAEQQSTGSKLTPVLEAPGKLSSFNIKKGKTVKFALTMANGDAIKSVTSSAAKYVKVSAVDKKNGKISLKAVKKGTAKITITLTSGKSRTYTVKAVTGTVKTTKLTVSNVTNKKLTLAKGKTFKLDAVVTPFTTTQKVTYKSSNKKIAKVTSSGKITAVAAGKTTITVTSGKKKVKITVTVPGITNVKSSVSVKKNKTLTLKPKTYGISGKVTYTSSNTKIATVTSKGKIKGIKKGTAKITIKAGTFTKTVTVKVK